MPLEYDPGNDPDMLIDSAEDFYHTPGDSFCDMFDPMVMTTIENLLKERPKSD